MQHLLKTTFILFAISSALICVPSFADDAADAGKLYKAGQLNEAIKKVDAVLAARPTDKQMRFLKGIIFTEQNKTTEAIAIFTKLTEEFPELPEPYNNLAVLYASSGQYLKASVALEMAIRTNPTYGTAHENLGDVYAKLASQAYDKALQVDSGNSTAKLKLNLVKNMIGNTTGGTNPKSASINSLPANPVTPPTTTQLAAATKPPATEVKTQAKSAPATSDQEAIRDAVTSWAKAWSSKDVNKYLSHYAKDFQTPKGESRSAWAEDRRSRIEGKGRISVSVDDISVSVDGNNASFRFKQNYTSDKLSANSRKTLAMVKQDGKWLIKQERSGN